MMWLRKSKKGFTLIELMVVVAIIAVLSLLGLRVYTGQATKARNSSVQANVHSLATELGVIILESPNPAYEVGTVSIANAATNAQISNPFVPDDKGSAVLEAATAASAGNTAGKIYYRDYDSDGDTENDSYRLEGIKNDGTILIELSVNYAE
jgi:type IV pilus assembly protein PilA